MSEYRAPLTAYVVAARDGRWSYGDDQKELAARKHGAYDTPAEAAKAAEAGYDIIVNTAPPMMPTHLAKKSWGDVRPTKTQSDGTRRKRNRNQQTTKGESQMSKPEVSSTPSTSKTADDYPPVRVIRAHETGSDKPAPVVAKPAATKPAAPSETKSNEPTTTETKEKTVTKKTASTKKTAPAKKTVTKKTAPAKKTVTKKTAPKKSPAPSAATAKRGAASGEAFAGFPLTSKIAKVSDAHGFRDGSIRATIFAKIAKCSTVADARKVSTDPWHLKNAVKSKLIKVS